MRKIKGFEKVKKEERIVRSEKAGIEDTNKVIKSQKRKRKMPVITEYFEEQQ